MAIRLLPFRQYAEQDVINLYALTSTQVNTQVTGTGAGDAGVFVTVTNGNLNDGPTKYDSTYTNYLGVDASQLPYVGRNQYPRVPLEVTASVDGDSSIGVTLYQTAESDENGQKLLYYPQKKLETQSVLPGEAVPVLSRGIIAVNCSTGVMNPVDADNTENVLFGINSAAVLNLSGAQFGLNVAGAHGQPQVDVVGSGIKFDTNADAGAPAGGQLVLHQPTNPGGNLVHNSGVFGRVLATGSRSAPSSGTRDQFAGIGSPATRTFGDGTGYYAILQFDTTLLASNPSA